MVPIYVMYHLELAAARMHPKGEDLSNVECDYCSIFVGLGLATLREEQANVCVFITAGPITKLFAGGGGGEWTTCAMIDDEPRPVWMSPLVTH
jgi:hypothetical protein